MIYYRNGKFQDYVARLIAENGRWAFIELASLIAEMSLTKVVHGYLEEEYAKRNLPWDLVKGDYNSKSEEDNRRLRHFLGTGYIRASRVVGDSIADSSDFHASLWETIRYWSRGRVK